MRSYNFCLSVWYTSLSILSLRFMHIVTNGRISFFFMAGWYSINITYIYTYIYIYSPWFLCSFIHQWTLNTDLWSFYSAPLAAQTVKEFTCNAGDSGSVPGLGRSPGEGNGNSLQYFFFLENSMDRGVWQAPVHGVSKIWTQLSN